MPDNLDRCLNHIADITAIIIHFVTVCNAAYGLIVARGVGLVGAR